MRGKKRRQKQGHHLASENLKNPTAQGEKKRISKELGNQQKGSSGEKGIEQDLPIYRERPRGKKEKKRTTSQLS